MSRSGPAEQQAEVECEGGEGASAHWTRTEFLCLPRGVSVQVPEGPRWGVRVGAYRPIRQGRDARIRAAKRARVLTYRLPDANPEG